MTITRTMTGWHHWPVLGLLLAAPALAQPVPVPGGPGPLPVVPMVPSAPRMTSDSPEYCTHLGNEFARALRNHPQASAESRMLADEGSRLCARGHLRAGIMRLRKALRMARSGY